MKVCAWIYKLQHVAVGARFYRRCGFRVLQFGVSPCMSLVDAMQRLFSRAFLSFGINCLEFPP